MRFLARCILQLSLVVPLAMPMKVFDAPSDLTGTLTVRGHYIIQRKPGMARAAKSIPTRHYFSQKAGEAFEVVAPMRFSRTAQGLGIVKEPLNWTTVREDCAEILKDPTVESCEPDLIRSLHLVPNDPSFASQWALRDLTNAADIGAVTAWDFVTGSSAVLVGVVDSGIYRAHPDLASNLWANPGEVVDGVDNDGNTYVDDINGIHTVTNSGSYSDCNGHGTHVSGIIAARGNNAVGICGVSWTVGLIGVNTDDGCSGSSSVSSIVEGFDYLIDLKKRGQNVRVVNASFGGDVFSAAEKRAIERLNASDILLVAAAGNSNLSIDSNPSYPASYDLSNIIAVGATGPTRERAYYSNFGQSVDIMAPGGDANFENGRILSTFSPEASGGGLYAYMQGTSMATPMVTGALALLASQRNYLTAAQLKEMLLSSAKRFQSLQSAAAEGRFLDLAAMVQASDPADGCPADPSKTAPGLCGCGVPDSSVDSDFDGTIDCQDGCPSDGAKLNAGVCGCGVAESAIDSDGDGTVNCLDGCPNDSLKTSAGVCGCGVSDGDLNGNGINDCLDGRFVDVTPRKASLKLSRNRLLINMESASDTEYLIEVTTRRPKPGSKRVLTKSEIVESSSAQTSIRKPVKGTEVRVRYAFRNAGTASDISEWSAVTRIKIVR